MFISGVNGGVDGIVADDDIVSEAKPFIIDSRMTEGQFLTLSLCLYNLSVLLI